MVGAFSSLYSLFLLAWANEQVYRNENIAFNYLTTYLQKYMLLQYVNKSPSSKHLNNIATLVGMTADLNEKKFALPWHSSSHPLATATHGRVCRTS